MGFSLRSLSVPGCIKLFYGSVIYTLTAYTVSYRLHLVNYAQVLDSWAGLHYYRGS